MKMPGLSTTLLLGGLASNGLIPHHLHALSLILQQDPSGAEVAEETPDGLSLRFDLSALPPDAVLISARFEVHPIPGGSGENRTFAILAPRDSFRQGQISDGSSAGPSGGQDPAKADSMGAMTVRPGWPGWIGTDVTAAAKGWLDDPRTNHGLALSPMGAVGRDSALMGPSIPWILSDGLGLRGPRLLVEYSRQGFGAVSLSRQEIGRICMCMNGRLTIRRSDAFAPESWTISSLDGKRIRPPRAQAYGEASEMDMTGYPKGHYLVALKDKAGRVLHTRIMVD